MLRHPGHCPVLVRGHVQGSPGGGVQLGGVDPDLQVAGEPISSLFFPETGMASLTASFSDGSQVEVGMFGYDSMIGEVPFAKVRWISAGLPSVVYEVTRMLLLPGSE